MFCIAPYISPRALADTAILAFLAAIILLFDGHSICAKEVRPLDLSGCIQEGGRVTCPNIAPPALIVISSEAFELFQKARKLSQDELDEVKKAWADK
jgi:hypothetical protein